MGYAEIMFTWTPQDYVGGPPIGGASSYGLAFRVRLENATLWNFSPTPPTTSGPLCSQGWVNVTGGCLIGTCIPFTLPPNRALINQRDMIGMCGLPGTMYTSPYSMGVNFGSSIGMVFPGSFAGSLTVPNDLHLCCSDLDHLVLMHFSYSVTGRLAQQKNTQRCISAVVTQVTGE